MIFWAHVWKDDAGYWARVHQPDQEETRCFATREEAFAWVRSFNNVLLGGH